MKQISPLSIWVNGETKSAEYLNAVCINLQLGTSAVFNYQLYASNEVEVDGEMVSQVGELLTSGNLDMSGDDYATWTTDDVAWDWIASKLNVEIIAE
jgi:hypothetical protein